MFEISVSTLPADRFAVVMQLKDQIYTTKNSRTKQKSKLGSPETAADIEIDVCFVAQSRRSLLECHGQLWVDSGSTRRSAGAN
jgi:hypothetical protein